MAMMQRFCLVTVVEQAKLLPNLSATQRKVLTKLEGVCASLDNDLTPSLSSIDSASLDP